MQKHVVSTTLVDPQWIGTEVLCGGPDLVTEITALKEREGSDIVLTGSISLGHDLLTAGLVDELRLFTYPVVLGRGRRLFPDDFETRGLELLEERRFLSGVVLLRYALCH